MGLDQLILDFMNTASPEFKVAEPRTAGPVVPDAPNPDILKLGGIPGCGLAVKTEDDPRPDLADDSHLWGALLRIAAGYHPGEPEKNATYCGLLNYLRCGGTRLRAGKSSWVIRPDIGPQAWETAEAYDEAKKCLEPWGEWVKFSLKKLTEEFPIGG